MDFCQDSDTENAKKYLKSRGFKPIKTVSIKVGVELNLKCFREVGCQMTLGIKL